MNNEGKVTNLTFSLSSGESGEKKQCTKAEFDFKGSISVDDASKLVQNFRDVVSEFEECQDVQMNDDGDDESTESDDDLPDLVDDIEPVIGIIPREEDEQKENDNEDPSVMRYPVRGNAMSLNNLRYNGNVVNEAWRTFSSIMVESSQPRNMYGHRLTHYRIVFPPSGFTFNQLSLMNGDVPDIFQGHGYPVCSCPSYNYKSYKITVNGIRVPGLCKHIDEALAAANIDATAINWLNRPDNLPFLLRGEELNEYLWVPQPVIAPGAGR